MLHITTEREHEEILGGDGTVVRLDGYGDYADLCMCSYS